MRMVVAAVAARGPSQPPPLLLLLLVGSALVAAASAAAFFDDGAAQALAEEEAAQAEDEAALSDYADAVERLLQRPSPNNLGAASPPPADARARTKRRRACIRRGGSCDHRAKDCCYNSACRCNLWGANCRCQRMGLFQKWGK